MADDDAMAKCRSEIIRCCWLGNGIVNNLQEPSVQLAEFIVNLPLLQDCLAKEMLSGTEHKMLTQEIERQIQFMNEFKLKLDTVLAAMHLAARGKHGAV